MNRAVRTDYRGHLKHVLSATQDEFDREFLNHFCDLTSAIRTKYGKKQDDLIKMKGWLVGKRAMLYFTQPSTRTFISFVSACQMLGIDVVHVQDPNVSSSVKGESELDSIRTFSSFVDIIIMRSPISGLAVDAARHLDATKRPVPLINAGGGTKEHPTQALLDLYTFDRTWRKQGRIDNKVIVIVGDLRDSRTVHSLCYLLRNYRGIELRLVSPPELAMPREVIQFLKAVKWEHESDQPKIVETDDLDAAVDGADAVYLTRLQKEYKDEEIDIDYSRFALRPVHLETPRKMVILHPMPRGPELPPELDADPRNLIWRQQRNGMWTRTALLYLLLWKMSYEKLMVS